MISKRAMILAAGFGTRLTPYTLTQAKPALPFLGLPLIAYPIFQLYELGCTDFVINLHHQPESIKKVLASIQECININVIYSLEKPDILLSGGGLKYAESHFNNCDSFFVANADNVVFFKDPSILKKMYDFHCQHNSIATLLTKEDSRVGTQFGGVEVSQDEKISGFSKNRKDNKELLHYIGFQIYSQDIFNYLPEGPSNLFTDGILSAIQNQATAFSYKYNDSLWLETGTIDDYNKSILMCEKAFQTDNQFQSYAQRLEKIFNFKLNFNKTLTN